MPRFARPVPNGREESGGVFESWNVSYHREEGIVEGLADLPGLGFLPADGPGLLVDLVLGKAENLSPPSAREHQRTHDVADRRPEFGSTFGIGRVPGPF